jgi:hypothetical protein
LSGTLFNAVGSDELTLDVLISNEWPAVPEDVLHYYVLVGSELMKVVARGPISQTDGRSTFTVQRAQYGTLAASQKKGEIVYLRMLIGNPGPMGPEGPIGPEGPTVVWPSAFFETVLMDGQVVLHVIAPSTFAFAVAPDTLAGWTDNPAGADTAFTMYHNGIQFGTINWPAGSNVPVLDMPTPELFAVGDRLKVVNAAQSDMQLSDWSFTLLGQRL